MYRQLVLLTFTSVLFENVASPTDLFSFTLFSPWT